ncbi:hypothetical protein [Pseudobdellovibrio exovorus]|uniref:Uncharacterized protein n=1 Tax=Pseudobdellovibrio exovorus JSS TaxID=1184267 RepID=M4VNI5_9BACT|nr:hypothetical protein [Pseudobdellovibrio exovorus]AGH94664.1 hypothetical protein A11Q_444 [Pseudobdellovibrio exovorus JSS]
MICPSCQSDVSVTDANYGALYTCEKCQAVYFVNFDGQPEFGEVPDEAPLDLNSLPVADDSADFSSEFSTEFSTDEFASIQGTSDTQDSLQPEGEGGLEPSFDSSFEPLVDSINVVTVDPAVDPAIGAELLQSQSPEFESLNDVEAGMNPFENLISADESADVGVTPDAAIGFAGVAKEISDFGNTEVQLAGLNYDLKITGLDTQETMRLFKEAIEDSKFGWDAADILKNVRNGQVEFKRLSPVKAYILAKRLQFLDIEKQWRQHVLS